MKEAMSAQEAVAVEPSSQKSSQVESPDVPSTSKAWIDPSGSSTSEEPQETLDLPDAPPNLPDEPDVPPNLPNEPPSCVYCRKLLNDKRKLKNKVKTLRGIVTRRRKEMKTQQKKSKTYFRLCQEMPFPKCFTCVLPLCVTLLSLLYF